MTRFHPLFGFVTLAFGLQGQFVDMSCRITVQVPQKGRTVGQCIWQWVEQPVNASGSVYSEEIPQVELAALTSRIGSPAECEGVKATPDARKTMIYVRTSTLAFFF